MATIEALINKTRLLLDDEEAPGAGDDSASLWKNEELADLLNEAVNEACIRAKLIVDSITEEVARIAVTPGKALYTLDSRVLLVERVLLATGEKLVKTGTWELDETTPGWETLEQTPTHYIQDVDASSIRLVGIPIEETTLHLTVRRLPLTPITWATREIDGAARSPEIPQAHHDHLLDYVLAKAYSKKDIDTHDATKSADHFALFSMHFGPPENAAALEEQRKWHRRRVRARFM